MMKRSLPPPLSHHQEGPELGPAQINESRGELHFAWVKEKCSFSDIYFLKNAAFSTKNFSPPLQAEEGEGGVQEARAGRPRGGRAQGGRERPGGQGSQDGILPQRKGGGTWQRQ